MGIGRNVKKTKDKSAEPSRDTEGRRVIAIKDIRRKKQEYDKDREKIDKKIRDKIFIFHLSYGLQIVIFM